ncbi:MAG: L,D-transpeptidase family protein [Pseudomonadota bacterium]
MAVVPPSITPQSAQAQSVKVVPASSEPTVLRLTPRQALLRETLLASTSVSDGMMAFYTAQGFVPVWTGRRIDALNRALATAASHGLPAGRYPKIAKPGFSASDSARVSAEIAAAQVFLRFARDLNSGVLEPKSVDAEIHVFPRRPDEEALLNGVLSARNLTNFIAALAPSDPGYDALMEERTRLARLARKGGWGPKVPAGKTLRPGQSGARVEALRARLGRILGQSLPAGSSYDESLIAAVKTFQDLYGLNADGVAGPATLQTVNATVGQRLGQVYVNLERHRWLNFNRGTRHIYVNQADYTVQVVEKGRVIYTSRTVIGKTEHQTPEFSDQMTHLVVNPTWHVPRSIATEKYLPELKRNPRALNKAGIQVMTRSGKAINAGLVDFRKFSKSNFPFIMKQPPGPGNALGRVKFMFPNQFAIYLHDTPAKRLFNRDLRAYSHGCIRVQKPFELAEVLLAPQMANPKGTFQSLLNAGRERQVNLDAPVPVHLTYQTAWVTPDGTPQYRADIYGRDAKVLRALERAGVALSDQSG